MAATIFINQSVVAVSNRRSTLPGEGASPASNAHDDFAVTAIIKDYHIMDHILHTIVKLGLHPVVYI